MATGQIVPARLREARRFLGFTLDQVAERIGRDAYWLVAAEAGREPIPADVLATLAGVYRRPLWWLAGETRWKPTAGFLRLLENMAEADRETMIDFAEWLADAGDPPSRQTAERWMQPTRRAAPPPVWLAVQGDYHKHGTPEPGWIQHGHAGGDVPHAHDRGTGFQLPAAGPPEHLVMPLDAHEDMWLCRTCGTTFTSTAGPAACPQQLEAGGGSRG